MKSHANSATREDRTDDCFLDDDFTFENMLLPPELLTGLHGQGFRYPTVVQKKGIPIGRCGYDMLVQSKSGTGKTLVYTIITLDRHDPDTVSPQAVIITPTREIAKQTQEILSAIGGHLPRYKAACFIGGLSIREDRTALENCSTVVGTPGRILHLIKSNMLNLKRVKLLVLDEADVLLGGDFELDKITAAFPPQKYQTICVSATVDADVVSKVKRFVGREIIGVTPKREIPVLLGVAQFRHRLPNGPGIEMLRKFAQLKEILSRVPFKQCIVFTNSQSQAESYKELLVKERWPSEVITGQYEQKVRLEIFRKLKEFKIRVLLSTDLMARGIDAENVNLVVNMDVPVNGVVYLHRIGRAGRFGTKGLAITLTTTDEQDEQLLSLTKQMTVYDLTADSYTTIWNDLKDPARLKIVVPSGPPADDVFTESAGDEHAITTSQSLTLESNSDDSDSFVKLLVDQTESNTTSGCHKVTDIFAEFEQLSSTGPYDPEESTKGEDISSISLPLASITNGSETGQSENLSPNQDADSDDPDLFERLLVDAKPKRNANTALNPNVPDLFDEFELLSHESSQPDDRAALYSPIDSKSDDSLKSIEDQSEKTVKERLKNNRSLKVALRPCELVRKQTQESEENVTINHCNTFNVNHQLPNSVERFSSLSDETARVVDDHVSPEESLEEEQSESNVSILKSDPSDSGSSESYSLQSASSESTSSESASSKTDCSEPSDSQSGDTTVVKPVEAIGMVARKRPLKKISFEKHLHWVDLYKQQTQQIRDFVNMSRQYHNCYQ